MCFLDECGESISIREVTVPEYCGNLAANLLDMISENASRQRNGLAEAYPYSAFEELAGEIDALAARFAVQEAELAEARSIAVSHDWELGGSLDFVNRKLNLKVYVAGSEGWRITCLCRTLPTHRGKVDRGTCPLVQYHAEHYEDFRPAIAAAEKLAAEGGADDE